MSYSFSVRAANAADAKAAVAAKLDEVETSQPIHKKDKQAAQDTAEDFIDQLGEPGENQDIGVSVSGSLSWSGTQGEEDFKITGANVSVSASLLTKAAAE